MVTPMMPSLKGAVSRSLEVRKQNLKGHSFTPQVYWRGSAWYRLQWLAYEVPLIGWCGNSVTGFPKSQVRKLPTTSYRKGGGGARKGGSSRGLWLCGPGSVWLSPSPNLRIPPLHTKGTFSKPRERRQPNSKESGSLSLDLSTQGQSLWKGKPGQHMSVIWDPLDWQLRRLWFFLRSLMKFKKYLLSPLRARHLAGTLE